MFRDVARPPTWIWIPKFKQQKHRSRASVLSEQAILYLIIKYVYYTAEPENPTQEPFLGEKRDTS